MTWFLVDDGFFGHPKTSEASLEALGLWTLAGSWSGKYLTEGMIPKRQVEKLGGSQELAQELVRTGLWLDCNDYYQFYDWFGCNPHKEDVLAKRKKKEESGRKGGLASGRSRRSKSKQTRSETRSKTEANAEAKPKQTRSENEPNTNTNTNTNINTPSYPPSGGAGDVGVELGKPRRAAVDRSYTPQFEQFWNLYPQHRRKEKPKAFVEWKQAIKRADPDVIIEGLRSYLTGDVTYAPYPAKWLKTDSWQDGPDTSRQVEASRANPAMARRESNVSSLQAYINLRHGKAPAGQPAQGRLIGGAA